MSSKIALSILALSFFICLIESVSIRSFTADVKITKDPYTYGTLEGKFYYSASANDLEIKRAIQYTNGPLEIFLWANTAYSPARKYLKCKDNCDTEVIDKSRELLYLLENGSGEQIVNNSTINGVAVTQYRRLTEVYDEVDFEFLYVETSSSKIVRAVQRNGRQLDFSNVVTSVDSNIFTIQSSWKCPTPQCNALLDIFYVVDCSSSISASELSFSKAFLINLTNTFNISASTVNIGVIAFNGVAFNKLPISYNKGDIITAINGITTDYGTCIHCGLQMAINSVRPLRAGLPVKTVFITATDGKESRDTGKVPGDVAAMRAIKDLTSFTIGIGPTKDLDENQLNSIASSVPGLRTYWYATGYEDLYTVLADGLASATCQALPGNPCGPTCRGFCGCGRTCQCITDFMPTGCDDGDSCTVDVCIAPNNGFGCQNNPKTCDDTNPCTVDSCNSNLADGCVFASQDEAVLCSDSNPCTDDKCNPITDCGHFPKNCTDGSACTTDSCNPTNGSCTFTAIEDCKCADTLICAPVSPCVINACNPSKGECEQTPVVCVTGNKCTLAKCDPSSGCILEAKNCDDNNKCTVDDCDLVTGNCTHTPLTPASPDWDDKNACTTDRCDAVLGIIHENITCTDSDACTEDGACDSLLGCYGVPKDCGTILKDNITDACKTAFCNSSDTTGFGCYVGNTEGKTYDVCGVCDGTGLTCVSPASIGLGAGVIAAIVIAAAVAAALIAAGSYKGLKYYQQGRGPLGNVHKSPLYQAKETGGESPLYQG